MHLCSRIGHLPTSLRKKIAGIQLFAKIIIQSGLLLQVHGAVDSEDLLLYKHTVGGLIQEFVRDNNVFFL